MWNVVSMVNRYVTCVCLYVWDERGGETTSYGKQLLVFQPPRERERTYAVLAQLRASACVRRERREESQPGRQGGREALSEGILGGRGKQQAWSNQLSVGRSGSEEAAARARAGLLGPNPYFS